MINIDSRILRQVDADELYLLVRLVNRMNKDGICWPGIDLLAEECQWSRSKVLRVKERLCARGIVECVTRRRDDNQHQMSNIYKLKTKFVSNYIGDAGAVGGNGMFDMTEQEIETMKEYWKKDGTYKRRRR